MLKYILRRLAATVVVAFSVLLIVFFFLRIASGNPARLMLPDTATEEQIEKLSHELGFDRPILVQFWDYLVGVFHGDLGTSLQYKRPCIEMILQRFPQTALLALAGSIVAVVVAVPFGLVAGVNQGTGIDLSAMGFALLFQSMSTVWLAILLILIFSVKLGWLPSFGEPSIKTIILPALTLGLPTAGEVTRMARSGIVDVLREDYITATYARGISKRSVYCKYALKNALIPCVTLIGMSTAGYLGGAVITESIFSWPGIGLLAKTAINQRDYPLVQALLFCFAIVVALMNLFIDILNSWIDRRIVLQ